jgi:photosystem II PsbM protein
LVWIGPPTTTGDEADGIGPASGDTVSQLQRSAMETNDLGFVASLMFVLVPAVFLIILYIQTNSRQS